MRILTLLCLAQVLSAQGGDPWGGLRSSNPAGAAVTLKLIEPHPFRQGERIAAELSVPGNRVAPGPPPGESWQFAGLLLDPAAECGEVAKPCFLLEPGLMNGPHGVSAVESVALNSYLPPLAPGRYHVAALTRKLTLRSQEGGSTVYGYADPPRYAVSETSEIEVVPATTAWVAAAVARNSAALRESQPRDMAGYTEQREAAQQLAFLDDPAAWAASLDALPKEEAVLLGGLGRGRPASRVCELMQSRIPAPAQSVSSSYLYRLTEICAKAQLPAAPSRSRAAAPAAMAGRISDTPPLTRVAAPDPEMQSWLDRQRAFTEDVMNRAAAALAGSLGSKQDAAKWDAFATLLQRINQVRANRPPEPDPAWIPLLTSVFTRDFASVEAPRQQYLLDLYASTLDSPDVAPLFESVLDRWKPGDYYEATRSALRALSRVDPARARARILAEMVKETTWLDAASLDLLPPSAVAPMDDALIDALAEAQRPGGWNPQLRMAAIARYATAAALPRIRAIYESQQDRCEPELAAYFVRVDPDYGERIFQRHPWNMHATPPPCTLAYFERTPPLAMGPPLERYLAAHLMHSDVNVKRSAARALARYGSPSALPALWGAFRYFHEYWKGKNAELERLLEGVELEVELRNAIARGRGWLVTAADLREMESLCISGRCVGETRRDRESMKSPLQIEILPQASGISGRVAQYFGLDSVEAVETKLAQYARGTQFVLYSAGGGAAQAGVEIRRFAEAKGMVVTTR